MKTRWRTPPAAVLTVLTLLIMLSGNAAAAPAAAPANALGAATVTYNLFATDTFITLANGTVIYNYGFVGGRAGVPLTYQKSAKAAVGPGLNATIATGAPAPTGGPVTAAETPLLGNAQFPAPIIYATTNDVVQINFKNLGVTNKGSPNDPHSIHLHGLDVDAGNDGVPETSVGAVPANLAATPGAGNVIVYMFQQKNPGTYMYHCHQEADIHVQMGMYGALVIYDPLDSAAVGGPGTGTGGTLWGWKYDKDVILMLTEVDVRQHASEQAGAVGTAAFNPVNYKPQYWMINGLSFPNTIHAAGAAVKGGVAFNWANWIAAHPGYDPFIQGSVGQLANTTTGAPAVPGQKVLLRVINLGFETQPMHMHGFHGKIIGSDQRAWTWANAPGTPVDQGLEKNTLTIGSGETYEWLLDFNTWAYDPNTLSRGSTATYAAGTESRYGPAPSLLPALNTLLTAPAIPVPAVVPAANYIAGPTVTGAIGIPTAGQLFPFHNHDDYKATNNGVYPGGMFTMIETVQ